MKKQIPLIPIQIMTQEEYGQAYLVLTQQQRNNARIYHMKYKIHTREKSLHTQQMHGNLSIQNIYPIRKITDCIGEKMEKTNIHA